MNKIVLSLSKKEDSPQSALQKFGNTASNLLRRQLSDHFDVIRVRGTIREGIDIHLLVTLKSDLSDITLDLSTETDKEIVYLVNGEKTDYQHTLIEGSDILTPQITQYLHPSAEDLKILLSQEETLQYPDFSSTKALKLIETILSLTCDPVAITITRESDQTVIAQYVSDEKSSRNVFIASGKRNMALAAKHSSVYAYCKNYIDSSYAQYTAKAPEYICGAGAFPIFVNHQWVATIALSGLKEGKDHDVIIDALNMILNQNVPKNPSLIF